MGFATADPSGKEEEEDGYHQRNDGEDFFVELPDLCEDEELDGESDEEEEIELEEGDVDLCGRVSR